MRFLDWGAPAIFLSIGLSLIVIAVSWSAYMSYTDHQNHISEETILITGKEIFSETKIVAKDSGVAFNETKYLIFVEGEVLKANSLAIYGQLAVGKSYKVIITGSKSRRIKEVL